jgi:RNA-binding protein
LQRIGHVLHISASGNMILKAEKNVPRVGDQATDENLKTVGAVFDVFGPVSNPYVAVRPSVDEPSDLVQHVLYATPSKKNREKRKRRRR